LKRIIYFLQKNALFALLEPKHLANADINVAQPAVAIWAKAPERPISVSARLNAGCLRNIDANTVDP
jgi:hypothetical protein